MKRLTCNLLLILGLGASAQAQQMSLSECIGYAIEHNTSIEQRRLQVAEQEVQLNTDKMSHLPGVSASMGNGWGFGRSTSREGTTVDRTSTNASFQIGANMELFNGFRTTNQIKSDKFLLLAATENLEKASRDISIQVASYYLNALYYKGMVEVQRRQLELDKKAYENARTLYEAGKKPQSEVATAEAQVSMTEHSLTEALGNETMARLDLMQLLNLEGDVQGFSLLDIDTTQMQGDIAPADLVFAEAVENYPSIKAAKYNLESSKYQLKMAKSGYLPTLSANASYSNSYNYMYDMENMKFGKQLDLNGSEYVGLNLSIPIFDRFQTRNSKRRARLNIESQKISLIDAQQTLHKEIQQAYWNAMKARDNYASAQKANASTSIAYQYEAERYAAGKGTAYDLQQARTKYEKALHDELQSKYEFLMRLKILDFYNGVEMK